MKTCLDLFSGLGGFSRSFEADPTWNVTTLDLDPDDRFNPDITADIMDIGFHDLLDRLDIGRGEDDLFIVLASPPCTDFSLAASRFDRIVDGQPQTESARESVMLVYHTLGLIKSLAPDYWFMENPQGFLRNVIGEPEGRITLCQYGTDYMKPTDLWGRHPKSFDYRSCSHGDECHAFNTDWGHGGDGNMSTHPEYPRDPAKRARMPRELSEAIKEAVENPEPETGSAAEASW